MVIGPAGTVSKVLRNSAEVKAPAQLAEVVGVGNLWRMGRKHHGQAMPGMRFFVVHETDVVPKSSPPKRALSDCFGPSSKRKPVQKRWAEYVASDPPVMDVTDSNVTVLMRQPKHRQGLEAAVKRTCPAAEPALRTGSPPQLAEALPPTAAEHDAVVAAVGQALSIAGNSIHPYDRS